MRAQFISEALEDILKPKSEEELKAAMKTMEVNKLFKTSVEKGNMQGVLTALKRGAFKSLSSHEYVSSTIMSLHNYIMKYRNEMLDVPSQKFLDTLLKRAAQNGFTEFLRYAVEKGGNVNSKDSFGSTPLYYAAKYQHYDAVKFLVEKRANIDVKNKAGMSILEASISPSLANSAPPFDKRIFIYFAEQGAEVTQNIFNRLIQKYNSLLDEMIASFDPRNRKDEMVLRMLFTGSIRNLKTAYKAWGGFDPNKKIGSTGKTMAEFLDFRYNSHNKSPIGKLKYLMSLGAKITPKVIDNLRDAEKDSIDHVKKYPTWGAEERRTLLNQIDKLLANLQVDESMGNVLRPKANQQIISDIAQEIELDLLSDGVSFFEHVDPRLSGKWYVGTPSWNISNAFDNYHEEFGPGYYVMSRLITEDNIPMEHAFPENRMVAQGTIQYLIPQTQVNNLIKELVSLVMTGQLGRGFHIKYFKPDETKNVQR